MGGVGAPLNFERARRASAATALVLAVAGGTAGATVQQGGLEARARIAVQGALQHDGVERPDFVQQRNELRFELKYEAIRPGQTRFGLKQATLYLVHRGRYDSAFDLRDDYADHGYDRDDFRFPEGKTPREVFVDFRFAGRLAPVSLRIGRQQVVWGEADVFRSLDVVNPLRIDQMGILGDDFGEYREPLWIAKLLWSIGQAGPVSETGVELFYSPNGRPLTDRLVFGEEFRIKLDNPIAGPNRRPVQLPFRQLRHPWELSRDGIRRTEVDAVAELGDILGNSDLVYLNSNGISTSTLSTAASMTGIRLLGKTFASVDFTVNYLFKRTDLPGSSLVFIDLFDPAIAGDGSPNARPDKLAEAAAAELLGGDANGNGIPDGREGLIRRCLVENEPVFILASLRELPGSNSTTCLTKAFWYPWTHLVGGTLTYNDFEWTGMIFRLEQSFSTKEPRNGVRPASGARAGEFPTERDIATNLMRTTPVWRSMVGFDWLRAFPWVPVTRYDPWFLTFQFLNEYYAHAASQEGLIGSESDRMQHWNPLFTLVATGYFLNSRLRPILATAYDVNAELPVFWLQGEWFFDPRWTVRIGDVVYAGSRFAESFLFLNKYADRDTLYLQVSYWFL